MKTKLFTLFLALAASMGTMYAVKIGDLYYRLNSDFTATVVEQNTSSDNYKGLTNVYIPSSIQYNGSTYSVTSIGSSAFHGCKTLTSITIPSTIISIEEGGLSNCMSLISINVSNDNQHYCADDNIIYSKDHKHLVVFPGGRQGEYEITNGVTHIDDYAFFACHLNAINIPDGVISIGNSAFAWSSSLTSVVIPNSVTTIGTAFYHCSALLSPIYNAHVFAHLPTTYSGAYTIPSGIELIAGGAFYGCTGLTSVTIPNSVTSIGDYAFNGCTGLTSPVFNDQMFAFMPTTYSGAYTIPSGIELIAGYAFDGCTGLTSVTIPNSVTSIGQAAFFYCTGLTSIEIPNSVTSIGNYVFYGCTGLTSITNHAAIPQTITSDVFFQVSKSTCTLYVPEISVDVYKSTSEWNSFEHIEKILTKYFTVQFLDWDNTILSSEQVEEETAATPPANPSRDWYTFTGWDKDFSAVTSDMTITAQYEEGQTLDNTIFFINGTNDSEISSQAIEIDFPTPPTIDGFTFLKWQVLAGDIEDGINIQAVYTADAQTPTPDVVTNPSNPAQKLIRDGNVYILRGDKVYTLQGQEVK